MAPSRPHGPDVADDHHDHDDHPGGSVSTVAPSPGGHDVNDDPPRNPTPGHGVVGAPIRTATPLAANPEPTSLLLIGTGLGTVIFARRRRARRQRD